MTGVSRGTNMYSTRVSLEGFISALEGFTYQLTYQLEGPIGLDLKQGQRAPEDSLKLGRPGDHSRRLGNEKWRVLGGFLGPA